MAVNLNKLASEVATEEGGRRSAGGVAQITEIIGILGRRWRRVSFWQTMAEVMAIRTRAGLRDKDRPGQQENVNTKKHTG